MKPFRITDRVILFYVVFATLSVKSSKVDNSANQTLIRSKRDFDYCNSAESASAKDGNGRELLYHEETRKCFPLGSRSGPCGKNMILYRNPLQPKVGFCDCDQGYQSPHQCSDYPVRRMIYIPNSNQCYQIFSQGPCLNGFWLNIEANTEKPVCQWNPCLRQISASTSSKTLEKAYLQTPVSNDGLQFWFYDPVRKTCYQTQKRGYCPVGMNLEITHQSHIPKCRKKLCHGQLTNFRSPLSCKPGSRYSYIFKGCLKLKYGGRRYYGLG